jgi:hypothetical protein
MMRRKIRPYAALFLGGLLTTTSALSTESSKTDSEQVSKLLSDAKSAALVLQRDAEQLSAFTQSSVSWQSYADQLSQTRTHVNKVSSIIQQLNDLRVISSQWQKIAINRLTPLLNDLAENTQQTITRLNANPDAVHSVSYRKYVSTHRELATDLASMIGSFVEYGRTKEKFDTLTRKLELPEGQQ